MCGCSTDFKLAYFQTQRSILWWQFNGAPKRSKMKIIKSADLHFKNVTEKIILNVTGRDYLPSLTLIFKTISLQVIDMLSENFVNRLWHIRMESDYKILTDSIYAFILWGPYMLIVSLCPFSNTLITVYLL